MNCWVKNDLTLVCFSYKEKKDKSNSVAGIIQLVSNENWLVLGILGQLYPNSNAETMPLSFMLQATNSHF